MNVLTLGDAALDLRTMGEVNMAGVDNGAMTELLIESAMNAGVRVLIFDPMASGIHIGQYEEIYFDFAQRFGARFDFQSPRERRQR